MTHPTPPRPKRELLLIRQYILHKSMHKIIYFVQGPMIVLFPLENKKKNSNNTKTWFFPFIFPLSATHTYTNVLGALIGSDSAYWQIYNPVLTYALLFISYEHIYKWHWQYVKCSSRDQRQTFHIYIILFYQYYL